MVPYKPICYDSGIFPQLRFPISVWMELQLAVLPNPNHLSRELAIALHALATERFPWRKKCKFAGAGGKVENHG